MIDNRIIYTSIDFNSRQYNIGGILDGNNHLKKLSIEDVNDISLVGNIYIGKVAMIQQNLDAAFVDIGDDTTVYCSLKSDWPIIYTHKFANNDRLCQGDEILLQIEKDPIKTKKAVATTNIAFDGDNFILTTGNRSCGISKKLPDEYREALKTKLTPILNKYNLGVVVRTAAKNVDSADLIKTIDLKCQEVDTFIKEAKNKATFSLLKRGKTHLNKFLYELNEYDLCQVDEFVTDSKEIYEDILNSKVLENISQKFNLANINSRLYTDETYTMNQLYGLSHQIEGLKKPVVHLRSGANLVIEPTEAMTVIDVNTSRNVKKNMSFLQVNKESAEEVVRQLILRNISGIIIVDFINLKSDDEKAELLRYLRDYASKASSSIQVLDYTKLGLVEMTKKKTSKSIYQILR
ncbi:MAG: ribonuclease E/G [Lachnospiraceae bacterium]|nr:ribonuclease E/G [Lachnospiraceae bacterium]